MPVALWVLLFVAIVPYLLAGLGGYMKIKHLGHLDNRHPRVQAQSATGITARVIAAQSNAWEALAFYAAVIMVCGFSGVDWELLTIPAVIFGITRVIHPILYLMNIATLRSITVVVGVSACIYMMSLAV